MSLASLITNYRNASHDRKDYDFAAMLWNKGGSDDMMADKEALLWNMPSQVAKSVIPIVKGIVFTLDGVMNDLIGEDLHSVTLILENNKCYNVSFTEIQNSLFVVMVSSDRCSASDLQVMLEEFKHILLLMCLPLEAVSNNNDFNLIQMLSELLNEGESNFRSKFGAVSRLQLPTKVYTDVGYTLFDLESCDYGEYVNDFFPHPRLYTTVGSTLFYKDVLVCSHLNKRDLTDVLLMCKYHCLFLLMKNEPVRHLVFWKEVKMVFIRTLAQTFFIVVQCFSIFNPNSEQTSAQRFLLIVGQSHTLLATLFETVDSMAADGPHPFFVDNSSSMLFYLLEELELELLCQDSENGIMAHLLSGSTDLSTPRITSRDCRMFVNRSFAVIVSSESSSSVNSFSTRDLPKIQRTCRVLLKSFDKSERRANAIEQGARFNTMTALEVHTKRKLSIPSYWLVGMRGLEESNVHVCHEETVPQHSIEVALKMLFNDAT